MAELEIRNLHVRAGEKQILRGLELTVGKGEIHALMGPNGSGKSTLANAIMGHPNLDVTEGQIMFKGEDVTEADPDVFSRMVLVDVEIALGLEREIETAMLREKLEHVIEESNTGRDIVASTPFDLESRVNLRLLRVAHDLCRPHERTVSS